MSDNRPSASAHGFFAARLGADFFSKKSNLSKPPADTQPSGRTSDVSSRGPSTSTLRSKPLGEILREQGSITLDQLSQTLEFQRQHGGLLGQILVKNKCCASEAIAEALQKQIKITDVKLAQAQIRISAATLAGRQFCEDNKLIPFEVIGRTLCIAMANPLNRNCIIEFEKSLDNMQIKTFRCPWPEIQKTIERAFTAAEQKKSRIQAAVQLDENGNPLPSGSGAPVTVPVAARPSRPLSGLHRATPNAQPGFERPPTTRNTDSGIRPLPTGAPSATPLSTGGQPGFERPPSVRLSNTDSAIRNAPSAPAPAASAEATQPIRPKTAPRASAVRPAITPLLDEGAAQVDDSWIDTKQNPHVVFHQRMLKALAAIGGAPGFLGRQIPDDLRQKCVITLGFLIAEHGALLRNSADFTLSPDALKQLDWKALVLRGLFCYHVSYPYVFGDQPKAFHVFTQAEAAAIFDKVRGHFKLFLKELNGLRNHTQNLVHVNQLEIDDTTAHLDRVYMLLPAQA